MKFVCNLFVLLTLLLTCSLARADLYSDLSELKKICDAELLTEDECKSRRANILARNDGENQDWLCNYSGQTSSTSVLFLTEEKSFSEVASASSVVKDILDEAGLAPNFVVRPGNVANAAASTRAGQRYVEYNPSFVSQLRTGANTNWAVYSVMAHEIGHHLQGHTIQSGGSRPAIEIEADEYSGFILARLGASLSEAQVAMTTFGSDSSLGTHPPTNARLDAIKAGWEDGSGSSSIHDSGQQPPAIPPELSVSFTDFCSINGRDFLIDVSGAILSKVDGYLQVGQTVPPLDATCAFDMVSYNERFCVANNGQVYFGSPVPIGQCLPCNSGQCD